MKFVSGVTFSFAGGSEQLFVAPIRAELAALAQWVAELESQFAATQQRVEISELPRSEYLPRLGRRRTRAAGATTVSYVDVYGRSALSAEWEALTGRAASIATVHGGDSMMTSATPRRTGYRTDGTRHSAARMRLPAERRSEIARAGQRARRQHGN